MLCNASIGTLEHLFARMHALSFTETGIIGQPKATCHAKALPCINIIQYIQYSNYSVLLYPFFSISICKSQSLEPSSRLDIQVTNGLQPSLSVAIGQFPLQRQIKTQLQKCNQRSLTASGVFLRIFSGSIHKENGVY